MTGTRSLGAGARLLFCRPAGFCPDDRLGQVLTQDASGEVATRYAGELAPDTVHDASLSADGRSVWLLLDRADQGRSYGLATADQPGSARVVGQVPVRPGLRDAFMSGFAPDDSLVAITVNADAGYGPLILLPTDGRPGSYHEGFPIGFLPTSVIEAMGGGGWAAVPGAAAPTAGTPASPQTADELAARWGSPSQPVVLSVTHPADVGAEGPPRTWDAGTASLKMGIGFVAACVGPGSMTIESDVPDVGSMTVDCTNGAPANEAAPGIEIGRDALITVTADPSTAWSVVIFDPEPSRRFGTPEAEPPSPSPGASATP